MSWDDVRRLPVPLGDAAVALVATTVVAVSSLRVEPNAGDRSFDVLAWVLVGLAGSALLLGRRAPLAAVGLVAAALVGYVAREYPGDAILLMGPLVLLPLPSRVPRRVAYGVAAGFVLVVVGGGWVLGDGPGVLDLLFVGWSAAAVLAGDVVPTRRRAREEEGRRRIAEERLRIARDLHDSVGHAMATINVHSGVAAHVVHARPDQAAEALEVIRQTSATVLDELAALVGVLRDEDAPLPLDPPAGLARIGALVDSTRRAGLEVDLFAGALGDVPAPVGAAAYRIVQESLTNVLRHAEATRATVTVTHHDALRVEVHDNGRGRTASPGRGIRGMQERASATGGHLDVGPSPYGGIQVTATWPPTATGPPPAAPATAGSAAGGPPAAGPAADAAVVGPAADAAAAGPTGAAAGGAEGGRRVDFGAGSGGSGGARSGREGS